MEKNVSEILLEELDILHNEIVGNLIRNKQVVTGKTKDSITHYLVTPYRGVLSGPAYLGVLEDGRGPAKGGGKEDKEFIINLKRWIIARGLDYGGDLEGLERLARFLKWFINKNGNWMFRNNQRIEVYTKAIDKFTKRLKDRIAKHLNVEVSNEIIQSNK